MKFRRLKKNMRKFSIRVSFRLERKRFSGKMHNQVCIHVFSEGVTHDAVEYVVYLFCDDDGHCLYTRAHDHVFHVFQRETWILPDPAGYFRRVSRLYGSDGGGVPGARGDCPELHGGIQHHQMGGRYLPDPAGDQKLAAVHPGYGDDPYRSRRSSSFP
jgi:hypothetical protein